mmetsp:Transcript_23162/g.68374  ORF Transcript_23162/g.68374 Transcript_23162/m.68374 type:complete len:243 (+) Transcript_23162:660-1388(+)
MGTCFAAHPFSPRHRHVHYLPSPSRRESFRGLARTKTLLPLLKTCCNPFTLRSLLFTFFLVSPGRRVVAPAPPSRRSSPAPVPRPSPPSARPRGGGDLPRRRRDLPQRRPRRHVEGLPPHGRVETLVERPRRRKIRREGWIGRCEESTQGIRRPVGRSLRGTRQEGPPARRRGLEGRVRCADGGRERDGCGARGGTEVGRREECRSVRDETGRGRLAGVPPRSGGRPEGHAPRGGEAAEGAP